VVSSQEDRGETTPLLRLNNKRRYFMCHLFNRIMMSFFPEKQKNSHMLPICLGM